VFVVYRNGLLVRRQSPIQVLNKPDVTSPIETNKHYFL